MEEQYRVLYSLVRVPVVAGNIEEIREEISATDQRNHVQIGQTISHYAITYEPGDQRGDVTVYHDTDRVAICCGGDSDWGDWIEGESHPDVGMAVMNDGEAAYSIGPGGMEEIGDPDDDGKDSHGAQGYAYLG